MKTPFRFQQFEVRDQGSAMKIGTDGVLLGSWAPIRDAHTIVDIGTGCGLIALMIGQRTVAQRAMVRAIDVDRDAAQQAHENFLASPWRDRLPSNVDQIHTSLQDFADDLDEGSRFDLAVCNPPYFSNDFLPSRDARRVARHTSLLPRRSLFLNSFRVVKPAGRLCLVLPYEQAAETIEVALETGFSLWTRTDVRPNPAGQLKRVLLEFGRQAFDCADRDLVHDELVVEVTRNQFTDDYRALTEQFHLRFAKDRR